MNSIMRKFLNSSIRALFILAIVIFKIMLVIGLFLLLILKHVET